MDSDVESALTIIANALRVAGHIAGRLGGAGQHAAQPASERLAVTAHA